MDLIKREDAIKAIDETPFIRRPILPHYIKAKINKIPSDENKGEWIPKEMWTEGVGMGEQYGRYYECSECHREYRGGMESCHNFCPNCGARMEGADNEID